MHTLPEEEFLPCLLLFCSSLFSVVLDGNSPATPSWFLLLFLVSVTAGSGVKNFASLNDIPVCGTG